MALTIGLLANGGGRAWADEEPAPEVLLLLDVSGSMNESVSGSTSRLEAARTALRRVGDSLPDGSRVGLRVYGSEIAEPKDVNPAACEDSELVLPIGELDRDAMYDAADSFEAVGETPIAYALEQSVDDFSDGDGKRVVVLISDGEENCVPDPCVVAADLAEQGVDLQFNAVGFGVGEVARSQLQCIAEAGHGEYFDAQDTDDLVVAIEELTKRSLRPFSVQGEPVEGTPQTTDAPVLTAGQYVDEAELGDELHYRIERQVPESRITVSVATIMQASSLFDFERWTAQLSADDGQECGRRGFASLNSGFSADTVFSLATSSDEDCADGPLWLTLTRADYERDAATQPFELLVHEEPPIVNLDQLPGPAESGPESDDGVEPSRDPTEVAGGTGFSDAPVIGPGSWTDDIALGETVLYRVPLETGQSLRVTLDAPIEGEFTLPNVHDRAPIKNQIFGPDRIMVAEDWDSFAGARTGRVSVDVAGPEVRVRNREDRNLAGASRAGDYYVVITADPLSSELLGTPLSIQLNIAVDGEPSGEPVYAGQTVPDSEASGSPSTGEDLAGEPHEPGEASDGPPGWVVPAVIGAGVLLAAVGVGAAVFRRRRG